METNPPTSGPLPLPFSGFRISVTVLCAFVCLVALLALAGWWIHAPVLAGIFYHSATMKPNTALCLILLSAAIAAKQGGGRWEAVSALLSCCAVALTAATLLEYGSGQSLGIDEVLAHVPAELAGDPAGRMSPGTAIAGLLSGFATLLLDRARSLSTLCAAVAGLVSVSALVGFVFDAGPLLGVPLLRSMSVPTAASFAMLQAAYVVSRPGNEPMRTLILGFRHHRAGGWFVVGMCLLPLLLGWPVALLYRRGQLDAEFAFALLVVLLMAVQTVLVLGNMRSLADVEERRDRVEEARLLLTAEHARQSSVLRKTEQQVAQSERQYRVITDALPALISYIDRDLRYVRVNRTYSVWFGLTASEIEGKTVEALLGVSAGGVLARLQAALAGEPQQFEAQFQTLQGERTVSISHMPDPDPEGGIRGVIVQANDITARRHTEAALRQTEKLAAVGKLASSIAHEINNPLEAVTNLLYLARTSTDVATIQEYLQTAEQEVHRVSVIASQTLRFHKQSTKPTSVSAAELFASVLSVYRSRLHERIRLEERHEPVAPIVCKEGEIRQVLNNLVGNALDAMQGTAGVLWIRSRGATWWTTGRKGLVLTVADSGSGMSEKTMESIFDAFFTTKGVSGTGLGLWVSKEIVDRHEGSLRVRSRHGERRHGTVFRLFLPYTVEERGEGVASQGSSGVERYLEAVESPLEMTG